MARTAAAALVVAVIVSNGAMARGQPAMMGVQDADAPLDADRPDLLLPPVPAAAPAQPHCGCCCQQLVPAPGDPTEIELTAVIAASATAAAVSYIFSAVFVSNQPHGVPGVDGIPVLGAIVAAQRNALDDRMTPLLLFSAGVQAIGILVAGVAGAELAARHRLLLDIGASTTGGMVGVTWRY